MASVQIPMLPGVLSSIKLTSPSPMSLAIPPTIIKTKRQLTRNPPFPPSYSSIAYILAALTAGGGITGYARTGSVPSIAAGCTVGALYALGGFRIQNRQPYGVELALLASIVLAGSSIPRAIKTQKPLPIGLSALAAFGLLSFGNVYLNKSKTL